MKQNKKFALEVGKYPEIYKRYLEKEILLVKTFIQGKKLVLDVGCGTGRVIPYLAPLVKKYIGIDVDKDCLKEAARYKKKYENVDIQELDANRLSKSFSKNKFDVTICLWSTIGCVQYPEKVMKQIFEVTKDSCLFSVMAKETLETRKKYYERLGIDYTIDLKSETFYSPVWGESRAYSPEEIASLCKKAGFHIDKISLVENLAYIVIAKKGEKDAKH